MPCRTLLTVVKKTELVVVMVAKKRKMRMMLLTLTESEVGTLYVCSMYLQ